MAFYSPLPMTMTRSDASISLAARLQAVGRGDRAALAEVYNSTSPKLMGVCLRILGERSEAEDVLQETYVTVWRRAGTFDPAKASAITWLVAVARNKALDRIRSGKVRRASTPLEDAGEIVDPARSALDEVEGADDRRALIGCLEELDDDQKWSIRTAFFDGVTYEELAARRGVPLGTMKSWVRRGLIKLRGCLEQ
jgi:RNA polymerase sigma factor (sigma-70 family)